MVRKAFLILLLAGSLLLFSEEHPSGFTVIVGKAASEDGSLLLAHSQELKGSHLPSIFKLPSRDILKSDASWPFKLRPAAGMVRTIPLLWVHLAHSEFTDTLANERGVVLASQLCSSREDKGEVNGSGIGTALERILAERSHSAREAVLLAGELIAAQGLASSGQILTIADPSEAWVLQIVRGKHWLACRLPDQEVAVIASAFTATAVDLADNSRFLGSPDIVEYAQKRGWYNPEKEGEFDFARAYGNPEEAKSMANVLRRWRGTSLLAERKALLDDPLPFSFSPRRRVRLIDLFRLLRDHYEGSEWDQTDHYRLGSPHDATTRPICSEATQYALVAQLRDWLPPEIGHLAWISLHHPDANAFVPWYLSASAPPQGYSRGDGDALWRILAPAPEAAAEGGEDPMATCSRLSELVERQYRERSEKVQKVWSNYENQAQKDIKNREKEYVLIQKNHRPILLHLLTNFVQFMEYRRWLIAADLIREFHR